jgi:SWI/SNF-related matrix-associated actin-dependent regulator 1 of chromatin subfamily A
MLRKYQGQLEAAGFDYATMQPAVTEPVAVPKAVRRVDVVGDVIAFYSEKDPSLVAKFREMKTDKLLFWQWPNAAIAAWQHSIKYLTSEKAGRLTDFANENGFTVSDAAKKALAVDKKPTQSVEQKAEAVALSSALVASTEVEGLGGTLRPFQKVAVAYAAAHPRTIIADEMGTGKTVEAIAILKAQDAFPALIVCPASVKLNWQREIEKWLPGKLVSVANGKQPAKGADLVVVNYDLIWREQYEWLQTHPWQGLVLDEFHAIKEKDSKRSAAVYESKKVIDDAGKQRWVKSGLATGLALKVAVFLSGTPIVNRPKELVQPLSALGLIQQFGGSWAFLQRYTNPKHNGFGWDFSGASNLDELNLKLRENGYIRRTKAQVLPDLPAIQRSDVPLMIDNRDEYDDADRDVLSWIAQNISSQAEIAAERAETLVRISMLKQIAAKGKMTGITEWVGDFLESGSKLLVFAEHVAVQKALTAKFPDAARIFGEDDVKERQVQVDRFQKDDTCKLMVASLKAGGEGLTLTAASHVAFCEWGWTCAGVAQAIARVHRIGQEAQSVNVYNLIGVDTIDEDIMALIASKREVVNGVTDGNIVGDLVRAMQRRAS